MRISKRVVEEHFTSTVQLRQEHIEVTRTTADPAAGDTQQ
ncbi:DUF2382 domain-containing protein [Hymenobacter lapidiphilus]